MRIPTLSAFAKLHGHDSLLGQSGILDVWKNSTFPEYLSILENRRTH
jgi:hypothetical protein